MNGLSKVITMTCMLLTSAFPGHEEPVNVPETEYEVIEIVETEVETEIETESDLPPFQVCEVIQPVTSSTQVVEPNYDIYTEEEIELIALVTMAEAEGETEYGKRLVIDTILNRVESEHFPDTVSEVVYQPNHFEAMWNGRVDKCYVDDDICELVREEIDERTDPYTIFFCAGNYSAYGEPMYQVGNHYFSSYE